MSLSVQPRLSQFALEVADGLSCAGQKKIPARFFYDDLGSSLFEAITLLPEYGLSRADERLLRLYAGEIASKTGPLPLVAELGSGNGKKTRHILRALAGFDKAASAHFNLCYRPIDVSVAALAACERELATLCDVRPVCGDWMAGLSQVVRARKGGQPLLLLFLGSSIGNLERDSLTDFLSRLAKQLRPGDFFLLGADLVKDEKAMLAAYDDPTGVTAAFNLNVLGRINRELDADFDLRAFAHEVRWNPVERRIEMHLLSARDQSVYVGALNMTVEFLAGETIWTESSHKFSEKELHIYARESGFDPIDTWVDCEWSFAEALWQVSSCRAATAK